MRVTNTRMLEAVKKNGGAVYLAARELGCAPNTIYNRMKKTPALKQAVEAGDRECLWTWSRLREKTRVVWQRE